MSIDKRSRFHHNYDILGAFCHILNVCIMGLLVSCTTLRILGSFFKVIKFGPNVGINMSINISPGFNHNHEKLFLTNHHRVVQLRALKTTVNAVLASLILLGIFSNVAKTFIVLRSEMFWLSWCLTHWDRDKMDAISYYVIDNMAALVRIMAWRRTGAKSLSEAMLVNCTESSMCHPASMS